MEVKWNEGRNMKSQGYLLEYRDGCTHLIMEIVCTAVRWRGEPYQELETLFYDILCCRKSWIRKRKVCTLSSGNYKKIFVNISHEWADTRMMPCRFFWKFWGNIYHRIFLWRSTSLRSALHIMNISLWL